MYSLSVWFSLLFKAIIIFPFLLISEHINTKVLWALSRIYALLARIFCDISRINANLSRKNAYFRTRKKGINVIWHKKVSRLFARATRLIAKVMRLFAKKKFTYENGPNGLKISYINLLTLLRLVGFCNVLLIMVCSTRSSWDNYLFEKKDRCIND